MDVSWTFMDYNSKKPEFSGIFSKGIPWSCMAWGDQLARNFAQLEDGDIS